MPTSSSLRKDPAAHHKPKTEQSPEGETASKFKVLVPKTATRRSVLSEVRQAIVRKAHEMTSSPARLARELNEKCAALRIENDRLREELRIRDPAKQIPLSSDGDDEKNEASKEPLEAPTSTKADYKELQACNYVLREMVKMESHVQKLLQVLTEQGSSGNDIRTAAHGLFQVTQVRLNAELPATSDHIARLHNSRMLRHLSFMEPEKLDVLWQTTSDHIRAGEGAAGDIAMLKAIRDTAVIPRLWNRTADAVLQKVDDAELKWMIGIAEPFLEHVAKMHPRLQSHETIPQTRFTKKMLSNLVEQGTVLRATNLVGAVSSMTNRKRFTAQERNDIAWVVAVHKKSPNLFSEKQKEDLKTLLAEVDAAKKQAKAAKLKRARTPGGVKP